MPLNVNTENESHTILDNHCSNFLCRYEIKHTLLCFQSNFNPLQFSGFAFKCFQGGIDGIDDERTKLTVFEVDCEEGVTKCLRLRPGNFQPLASAMCS